MAMSFVVSEPVAEDYKIKQAGSDFANVHRCFVKQDSTVRGAISHSTATNALLVAYVLHGQRVVSNRHSSALAISSADTAFYFDLEVDPTITGNCVLYVKAVAGADRRIIRRPIDVVPG